MPLSGLRRVLAENLARVRDANDWTEVELAKHAKIGVGSAHRILNGQNVTLQVLQNISQGLRIPAYYLLIPDYDPEDPPRLLTPDVQVLTDDLKAELVELRALRTMVEGWSSGRTDRASDNVLGSAADRPHHGAKQGKT
jgi:transcriptional regulator with XRE-family HTH domain